MKFKFTTVLLTIIHTSYTKIQLFPHIFFIELFLKSQMKKLSMLNYFALLIALCSMLILLLLSANNKNNFPAKRGEDWLLLIAHPDDETMFFAPTLLTLTSIMGVNLHMVSVSSGNSAGIGHVRVKELFNAASLVYGIPKNQVHILDQDEKQFIDGFHEWPISELYTAVLDKIHKIQPRGVITFDEWGVSGHPNHRACFLALKQLKRDEDSNSNGTSAGERKEKMIFLALESVPLWRKYSGMLDLFYSRFLNYYIAETNIRTLWTNPISVYQAMSHHTSQMLWFRYLYMLFSRYVYVNTFISIY